MNRLQVEKRVQILSMLCEGSSMRAISRVVDVSINTVTKLLVDAGEACAEFHDKNMRNVMARHIQRDEIWSFCYAKEKKLVSAMAAPSGAGSVWTWTALDVESKMIITYLIAGRDAGYAMEFMDDLKSRLANLSAIESSYGAEVDYAQFVKIYGEAPCNKTPESRYSPGARAGIRKDLASGKPDQLMISTSHVKGSNLSFRMHMRRYTRLTNAHAKKFENHCHMVALYTLWYNYARINSAVRMAPAMAAGISNRLWSMADIVKLIDEAAR